MSSKWGEEQYELVQLDWKEILWHVNFLKDSAIRFEPNNTDVRTYDALLKQALTIVSVIIHGKVDAEVLQSIRKA